MEITDERNQTSWQLPNKHGCNLHREAASQHQRPALQKTGKRATYNHTSLDAGLSQRCVVDSPVGRRTANTLFVNSYFVTNSQFSKFIKRA